MNPPESNDYPWLDEAPVDGAYLTGWSLERCGEYGRAFYDHAEGNIERSLAHTFHEWCEAQGVPSSERNKVWALVLPLVDEESAREWGWYGAEE